MSEGKREKILEEFERFMQEYDRDIGFTSYESEVLNGVHELLKAQEPRVLTLEEVHGSLKQPIWKEVRSSHRDLYTGWVLAYDIQTGQGITGTRLGMAEPSGRVVWYRLEDYGVKWRCWTSQPDEKRRAETPWE